MKIYIAQFGDGYIDTVWLSKRSLLRFYLSAARMVWHDRNEITIVRRDSGWEREKISWHTFRDSYLPEIITRTITE